MFSYWYLSKIIISKKKTMAHFWCLDFPHLPVSLPPCQKLNIIRCREAAPARFWFGFGVVFAKRIKISLTCDFFNSRFQTNFWKHVWLQTCSLPLLLFNDRHCLYMSHQCCKKLLAELEEESNNSTLKMSGSSIRWKSVFSAPLGWLN